MTNNNNIWVLGWILSLNIWSFLQSAYNYEFFYTNYDQSHNFASLFKVFLYFLGTLIWDNWLQN